MKFYIYIPNVLSVDAACDDLTRFAHKLLWSYAIEAR